MMPDDFALAGYLINKPSAAEHHFAQSCQSQNRMCAKSKLRVTCAQCMKRFYTKIDFARHSAKVHVVKVTNRIAPSNDARTFHLGHVTYSQDKLLYGCAQCFGHFITKQDLVRHCLAAHQVDLTSANSGRKQKHRQVIRIPCFYCPKRFPSEAKRLEHEVDVHQPNDFSKCDFCAKLYLDANAKEEHLKTCQLALSPSVQQGRSNNGLKAALPTEQQPSSELTSAMRRVKGIDCPEVEAGEVKRFLCAFCETAFVAKRRLNEHLRLKHAEQTGLARVEYKCDFCPKLFNYPSNKYSHIRAFHKRQRPHVCEHCGQTFAYPSKKKLHLKRMHNGGFCDAGFVDPAAKSLRMHKPVKRKLAAEPEFSFTSSWHHATAKVGLDDSSSNLLRSGSCQTVAVHGVKGKARTHRCRYCAKEFVGSANRRKHEKGVHHGILRFKCAFCEKTFRSSYHLKRHTNGVHRNERLLMCSSGQSQQEHGSCDQMLPNKPSHEPVELAVCSSDDLKPGSAYNSSSHPYASSSSAKSSTHRVNVNGNGVSQIVTNDGLRSKDRRIYGCTFCAKQFADRSNKSKHERRMHKDLRTLPYPCAFCDRMFRDPKHQRRHFWQSHRKDRTPESKRLLTSRDCPPTFTNDAAGRVGTKSTIERRSLPGCSSSGMVAGEPTDARRHARESAFSVPSVTSLCSTSAVSNSGLQSLSLAPVLRPKPSIRLTPTSWCVDPPTSDCLLGSKGKLATFPRSSSVDIECQLPDCNRLQQPVKSVDRTVNMFYNCNSQIDTSEEQKSNEESDRRCSFCAKLFASRKRKNRHELNVHNKGTLPYKCGFCYKAFPDRYHQVRHERFHQEKPLHQPNSLRNSRSYLEPPISPDICSFLPNNSVVDFTLLPEGCRYSAGVIASLSGRDQAEELGFASRVALSDSPNSVISDPGRLPSVSCGQSKSTVPFVTARKPAELETLGPAEPAAFVRICASGGSTFLIRRPDKPVTLRVVRSATRSAGQAAVNRVN